jgi:GNAT superfamily N-acetyltransferase
VRRAEGRDVEAIVRLINTAFIVERFFVEGDRIDDEEVRGMLGTGTFLLLEDGEGPAACVYVEPRGDHAYIGLLSVRPDRQRRGLGERMMSSAEEHARQRGSRVADIRVVNLRVELPPFYRRLGYAETGTEPFDAAVPPMRPCHFVLMSKAL